MKVSGVKKLKPLSRPNPSGPSDWFSCSPLSETFTQCCDKFNGFFTSEADQALKIPAELRTMEQIQSIMKKSQTRSNWNFFVGDDSFKTDMILRFKKQTTARLYEIWLIQSSVYSSRLWLLSLFCGLHLSSQFFTDRALGQSSQARAAVQEHLEEIESAPIDPKEEAEFVFFGPPEEVSDQALASDRLLCFSTRSSLHSR